ncbi:MULTISPECIES: FlhC family transcriptional regulator [unclassified Polaromonas]|jgi:hypothetical protein|uniref:FlhC family transcriptional regulator n=1 Tax=unclassified Polaromonas TaxID=2638319 RepID=UPI000BDB09F2|nr:MULTISPECIES: FlhC family transcriptional regulator [unclassified Polaromonas]OYY33376.1 MAG: hypothetical protein B7Y60_19300 [Polaromonas sp. 35-63-35]OYZ18310.1 MAG: hypothetical protein B7Y28_16535 [Polaromonas sp. 16-63-31]OYZ77030.1 MAG: hypothetical protein B7Y09_18125 [Polaromonas sp. 24-63-21]OZA48059.1 MAG: hypothetical protein B7X88_19740 [Polaromonas sp. 17-63-33]OZA86321.1 MAG: hypothetical protein B7X65_17665 [Polaromonas sp. 39-63-25]
MSKDIAMGRALAARNRLNLFDDPRWEERFEVLIRLTQRTQLIQSLTGTDVRPQRLKDAVDRRVAAMGRDIARPRGIGQSYTAKGFLSKLVDKYDAAYLVNLHYGANGPGAASQAETNLGAALDKRIEVYLQYRSALYENPDDARVSFETYVVLIDGVRNRVVDVHTCQECSSRFVWTLASNVRPTCPVCAIHQQSIESSRRKLAELLGRKPTDNCYSLRAAS